MRKILLLTTFLLANVAIKAKDLVFKYKGESLTDSAIVTIMAEEDFFGEMSCETNPSIASQEGLVLICPTALERVVTANLQIMSNTLNASAIQWCMGGECTLVRRDLLTKTFSPGPNVQVLFDATNITGDGLLIARLTVQFNSSTRTVFIQFVNGEVETSIRNTKTLIHSVDVFDLNGRKTNSQGSRFNARRKNLYIINGKKILK
ncbi:MAG: hypothetical protein IKQ51_11440 [Bacteroidaceae bacterium]|nr:hypothetical protein [Bacteroidaceae bacterium]